MIWSWQYMSTVAIMNFSGISLKQIPITCFLLIRVIVMCYFIIVETFLNNKIKCVPLLVVSGCSHSKMVMAAFHGKAQEGSCLGGRSPEFLCVLHAHKDSRKDCRCHRPLLAVRGRQVQCCMLLCLLAPKPVLGCSFKRALQQMLYLITRLFL